VTPARRTLVLGAVVLAAAVAAWAAWWRHAPRPSILLITVDTLRPDRLGCYGHPTNRTPAIDRLAREGAIFERAYCDTPWTTGSMSSVMTGYYPAHHGLRLPTNKLGPEAVTLAEILHAQGFQTGAVIASFPLDSVYGLDQGFETYDDTFTLPMIDDPDASIAHLESQLPDDPTEQAKFIEQKFKNDAYRPDEEVTDAAITWVDTVRDGSRPFFLWVHYFGPHEKLFGNKSFVEQEPRIVKEYDPDVEANDRAVGRLLDHLRARDLLDGTLVVLHADHGQNLGESEYVGHSTRLDDASVRIPLIVRYPQRLTPGTRRRDVVRNVDILPTVLDVARTTGVGGFDGRSLLPSFFGYGPVDAPADQQVAYFETYVPTIVFAPLSIPDVGWLLGPVERHGVRTPDWKLVTRSFAGPCTWGNFPSRDPFGAWSLQNAKELPATRCAELGQVELLRAGADDVLAPAVPEPADVLAKLRAEIDKHVARVGGAARDGSFALSPEQERKLKSLGYLQ
jgi:arylsulfatase A-like enzyme